MKCEYCGKEHDGSYGSGRFCCVKCARGFSTKAKRKEISLKASRALKGKPSPLRGRVFLNSPQRNPNYWTPEIRAKISQGVRMYYDSHPDAKQKAAEQMRKFALSEDHKKLVSRVQRDLVKAGKHTGWSSRIGLEPSYAERFWTDVLKQNNIDFIREYKVCTAGTHYFLDFLLGDRIDLEIDGRQHSVRKEFDKIRDTNLRKAGYIVYRIQFVNPKNKDKVKQDIDQFLSWYKDYRDVG